MKNFQKLALSLVIAGLAIGFSAFTSSEKVNNFAPKYYFNGSPEAWSSPGTIAADQTPAHYTAITPSTTYSCQNLDVVCTYDLVGGKYVLNSRGQNSLQ